MGMITTRGGTRLGHEDRDAGDAALGRGRVEGDRGVGVEPARINMFDEHDGRHRLATWSVAAHLRGVRGAGAPGPDRRV